MKNVNNTPKEIDSIIIQNDSMHFDEERASKSVDKDEFYQLRNEVMEIKELLLK